MREYISYLIESSSKKFVSITCSRWIWRQLLKLFEFTHRKVIAEMAFEQFVSNESFWSVTLGIDKGNMVIDVADSLQLIRMPMMMRTAINTNQKNCDMNPREAEEIEFKFIHVSSFTIK